MVSRLFNKLEKTKTEVINLKRTVRIQNELIGKLQKEQKKFELKNSSVTISIENIRRRVDRNKTDPYSPEKIIHW